MEVVGVQLDVRWEDKSANMAAVDELLSGSRVQAGSLVVLPEMFSTGFSMDVQAVVEGRRRKVETFLAELAGRLGATVVAGVATATADGRGLNQAVVFDPGGRQLGRYTKMHPFSLAGEADFYAPGEEIVTFPWGGFTVTPFICYDLRFPEVFRTAVRQGANLLLVIANWPGLRQPQWRALCLARAIENQAYLVGVNRCGSDPNHAYAGGSLIVDPRGELADEAASAECLIRTGLDLQGMLDYRRRFPALGDMRVQGPPGGS